MNEGREGEEREDWPGSGSVELGSLSSHVNHANEKLEMSSLSGFDLKANFTHYKTSRKFLWYAYIHCTFLIICYDVCWRRSLWRPNDNQNMMCDVWVALEWSGVGMRGGRQIWERGWQPLAYCHRHCLIRLLIGQYTPTHASDWLTESYTHSGGRVGDKHCYVVSTCHKLVTGRWGVSAIRRWAVNMDSSKP